jgi:LPXTG-site transpeptidase (sortase) family protein
MSRFQDIGTHFFRALRNIRTGDEITLETLDETYHYRVDLTQVVAPGETEVLRGSNDQILTLVTCYPFSFVGPRRKDLWSAPTGFLNEQFWPDLNPLEPLT